MNKIIICLLLFSQSALATAQVGDFYLYKSDKKPTWSICTLVSGSGDRWRADCDIYYMRSGYDSYPFREAESRDVRLSSGLKIDSVSDYGFLSIGDIVDVSKFHWSSSTDGVVDLFDSKSIKEIFTFSEGQKERFLLRTDDGFLVDRFYVSRSFNPHLGNYQPKAGDFVVAKAYQNPPQCISNSYLTSATVESHSVPYSSFKDESDRSSYLKTDKSFNRMDYVYTDEVELDPYSETKAGDKTLVIHSHWNGGVSVFDERVSYVELETFYRTWGYGSMAAEATVLSKGLNGQTIYFSWDDYEPAQKIEKMTEKANIEVGDVIVGNQTFPKGTPGKKIIGFNDYLGDWMGVNTLVITEDLQIYFAALCTKKKSNYDPSECDAVEKPGLYIFEQPKNLMRKKSESLDINRC